MVKLDATTAAMSRAKRKLVLTGSVKAPLRLLARCPALGWRPVGPPANSVLMEPEVPSGPRRPRRRGARHARRKRSAGEPAGQRPSGQAGAAPRSIAGRLPDRRDLGDAASDAGARHVPRHPPSALPARP